jgi:hypothetical protein
MGTRKTQIYSLPFEEGNELKIGSRNGLFVDGIHLTPDRVYWRTLVHAMTNIWNPVKRYDIFLLF